MELQDFGRAGDRRVAQAISGLRTGLEGCPCRICGGQSGTGRDFPKDILVFPFYFPIHIRSTVRAL
jgi:hypothetical protein